MHINQRVKKSKKSAGVIAVISFGIKGKAERSCLYVKPKCWGEQRQKANTWSFFTCEVEHRMCDRTPLHGRIQPTPL